MCFVNSESENVSPYLKEKSGCSILLSPAFHLLLFSVTTSLLSTADTKILSILFPISWLLRKFQVKVYQLEVVINDSTL